MDHETLSATGRKQVIDGRCRKRGRRLQHRPEPPADHGPSRIGTKDREFVSRTCLRAGNVEDRVDGCSFPDNERHDGPRNVVGNRSETGRRELAEIYAVVLQPGYPVAYLFISYPVYIRLYKLNEYSRTTAQKCCEKPKIRH